MVSRPPIRNSVIVGVALLAALSLRGELAVSAGRSEGQSLPVRMRGLRATAADTRVTARGAHRHRTHARHRHRARVNLRAYRESVARWHDPSTVPPAAPSATGRFVLRLYSVNSHARASVVPQRDDGGFDETAATEFARVLGDSRSGAVHAIDARLMDMVYQVAAHFHAPQVTVVSGFREGGRHSNHALGRALDMIIPGVSDATLAAYLQTLTNVGVGSYPVSGFVHLDVRDYNTHWVDVSGPGHRARYRHARRNHRHGHGNPSGVRG